MIRIGNGGRIGLALSFVLMAVVQLPGSSSSAQDAPVEMLELNGVGAGELSGLMGAWATSMYSSAGGGTSVSYISKGDRESRLKFSRGENDFVISGRPFTDEDKENLAQRKVGVIEAPISVTAMAMVLGSARPLTTVEIEGDPEDPDNQFQILTPFDGQVRIPNPLIAEIVLDVGRDSIWNRPEFLETFGDLTLVKPSDQPHAIVRSDAGAMSYYLESFLDTVAKADYDTALKNAGVAPDGLKESWPILFTPSRSGDDAVAFMVGSGTSARSQGRPSGGVLAPISPSAAHHQFELQKAAAVKGGLYLLPVQNAAGEWVEPTPETITATAAAGNGAPLYGLREPVPGTYPLTWISSIGVPSTGLSPEKATALSTLVRFAVTEGQNAAAPLGEGRLPATLAAQSVAAADEIVTSNCKGSDRTLVTVDGGGPYWPAGVAAPATTKVCNVVAAAGVTTTTEAYKGPANTQDDLVTPPPTIAAPPYVPPAVSPSRLPSSSGSSDPSYSGDLGPVDVAVESATTTPETSAPPPEDDADQLKVSSIAAELPLAMPGDGRYGLDRLVTAALGGAAFLFARSLFRKRLTGGAT